MVVLSAVALAGFAQPVDAATRNAHLPRAWTVKVGPADRVGLPVIYRGRAFTTDGSVVTAVDLASGSVRWQVKHVDPTFGPLYLGDPSLVDGAIWTPWSYGRYGGVISHDPKTGAFTTSNGVITVGHVVSNGTRRAFLYVAGVPGLVLIGLEYGGPHPGLIDLNTGSLSRYTDPVFAGRRHVWVGYGSSLVRFDPGTCVPAPNNIPYCLANATVPLAGTAVGLAAGAGNTVVATTENGVVEVHDGVTGAELWRATPGATLANPAVSGGVIAVGGSGGAVHAYDANGCGSAVCAPTWNGDAGAAIATAPAFGNGNVFVGTAAGTVVAFAAAGCGHAACAPIASGVVKAASAITGGPVFDGSGTIVVGTADGRLVAFCTP
jgi:outer membrane protein assembly factor BamB